MRSYILHFPNFSGAKTAVFTLSLIVNLACGAVQADRAVLSDQAVQAATIPLTNPGFEEPYHPIIINPDCPNISGVVADGWEENGCWFGTEAAAVYDQETAVFHGGISSQRVELTAGWWQLVQWLPLQAGQQYTATVWLRSAAPMQVTLQLRRGDEPYTSYASKLITVTPDWTQYTLSGLSETAAGAYILYGSDPGTLWIDDAGLTAEPAPPPVLPTATVSRAYFGVHLHRLDTPWPAVQDRLGTIRFWDCEGCQWAEVNTAPGVYDWAVLDARVAAARAHGADIVFNLGRTPRWASARPDEPSPYGPGQAAEPADDQTWRDWVTAVGNRYQGQITWWEVWNEPNDPNFYSGSIPQLVDLARQARDILQAIDPINQMVTPSPYDAGWLDAYLAAGGGEMADVIGFHFYLSPGGDAPQLLYQVAIPAVQGVLVAHGQADKPLWDTEAGWLALPDGTGLLPNEVAVGYVGQRLLLEWARGVDRMLFYAWDNHGVMSVEPTWEDNVTLTPSGVAYGEMAGWLTGAVITDLTVDEAGTWVAVLTYADGAMGYVVWNPAYRSDAPLDFAVPVAWKVGVQRDLTGGSVALADDRVSVEQRPFLLQPTPPTSHIWLPLVRGS